jgi:hypothetical protein
MYSRCPCSNALVGCFLPLILGIGPVICLAPLKTLACLGQMWNLNHLVMYQKSRISARLSHLAESPLPAPKYPISSLVHPRFFEAYSFMLRTWGGYLSIDLFLASNTMLLILMVSWHCLVDI